jgi:hypothetical protein
MASARKAKQSWFMSIRMLRVPLAIQFAPGFPLFPP